MRRYQGHDSTKACRLHSSRQRLRQGMHVRFLAFLSQIPPLHQDGIKVAVLCRVMCGLPGVDIADESTDFLIIEA